MKKKWYICLSMTLALMVFLTAMNGLRRKEEALASRIAPKLPAVPRAGQQRFP